MLQDGVAWWADPTGGGEVGDYSAAACPAITFGAAATGATIEGGVVAITASERCDTIGSASVSPLPSERALARLARVESIGLEAALLGADGTYVADLVNRAGAVDLGQAANPVAAIAAIEARLATTVGHMGVIHAPAVAAAYFAETGILTLEQGRWVTPLGCLVSFGSGYANLDPADQAAAAGRCFVWATGDVSILRHPDPPQVLTTRVTAADAGDGSRINRTEARATQEYALTVDAPPPLVVDMALAVA